MSGGEPSSIKQKPLCAAELPVLSGTAGNASIASDSNCWCAVLSGAALQQTLYHAGGQIEHLPTFYFLRP